MVVEGRVVTESERGIGSIAGCAVKTRRARVFDTGALCLALFVFAGTAAAANQSR